jgi:hypothetical protein
MEKKQTALDWYIEQNFNNIVQFESHQISQDEYVIAYNNLLNQAKQMEKEQIIDAYEQGDKYKLNFSGKQFFNETYGETKN